MSTPTSAAPRLTTQAVVLIIAVVFLIVGLVIGLVYLAGPDGRSDVFAWLSSVLALVASGGAITGVVQNRNLATTVAKVDAQTNGVLDARIANGVHAALVKAGVAPDQTVSDVVIPATNAGQS